MKKLILLFSFLIFILFAFSQTYIGLFLIDLNRNHYQEIGVKGFFGILIQEVEKESPAAKAKLMSGDLLIKMNEETIYTKEQFSKMLNLYQPDDTVQITVLRKGKEKTASVTLAKQRNTEPPFLGVYLENIVTEVQNEKGIQFGVRIEKIVENSPAENSGLKIGDIILRLNQANIYSVNQIEKMLLNFSTGDSIDLDILRSEQRQSLSIKLQARPKNYEILQHEKKKIFLWKTSDKFLGILGQDLSMMELNLLGIQNGVRVKEVLEDTSAASAGLLPGDIITKINSKIIATLSDLKNVINQNKIGEIITITILRDSKEFNLECKIIQHKLNTAFQDFEFDIDDDKTIRIILNGHEIKRIEMHNLQENMHEQIKKMKILKDENKEKTEEQIEKLKGKWKDIDFTNKQDFL
jgi:S1-C subfamily serine protease